MRKTTTVENVSYGHPDKIADQISDSLLDMYLIRDRKSKVAIETMVKDNTIVLGGEVETNAILRESDIDQRVRRVVRDIGYSKKHGFHYDDVKIINLIGKQSNEINEAVDNDDDLGAGDQGIMVGYAASDTPNKLPLGVYFSKKLIEYINKNKFLGPDAKSQVTVTDSKIDSILVSTMHHEEMTLSDVQSMIQQSIEGLAISDVIFEEALTEKTDIYVNPGGEWTVGGPIADCGLTGRKIVVDQFGIYAPTGGGGFSGKDYSKTDRSAAYMCRYIAKNIVAAGLAEHCQVDVAYMIGVSEPVSFNINTFGYSNDFILESVILKIIDMRPITIKKMFGLDMPDPKGSGWNYELTAKNGHYGSYLFPWEQEDMANYIRKIYRSERKKIYE